MTGTSATRPTETETGTGTGTETRTGTGTGATVVIGVDLGGTKTAAGVVTLDGRLLHSAHLPTPAASGAAAVLSQAVRLAAAEAAWAGEAGLRPVACGVGSAGTVDARGEVSHATTALPGWRGTPLRAAFTAALDLPVRVLNDVHAWALGEARLGAALHSRTALVVTVGTGIGGALVVDGELVPGRTGTAGALGHLPVPAPGPARRCPCGRTGHLEAYASGPAILARHRELGGAGEDLADVAGLAAAAIPAPSR
ncbi:ROK family protein [Streptosporangium sp. KLBMP 9127]